MAQYRQGPALSSVLAVTPAISALGLQAWMAQIQTQLDMAVVRGITTRHMVLDLAPVVITAGLVMKSFGGICCGSTALPLVVGPESLGHIAVLLEVLAAAVAAVEELLPAALVAQVGSFSVSTSKGLLP